MKYAKVNNVKRHAKEVQSGTLGRDLWYENYEVIACVGKYRQYWKYIDAKPCLPNGYEPESEWHSAWKNGIDEKYTEVICGENKEHRADIKTNKYVIEIQKSRIDSRDVVERIKFYKELTNSRVIWIVNIEIPWKNKKIKTELVNGENDKRFYFKWKNHWKWVYEIAKNTDTFLFLDFNPKSDKLIYLWNHNEQLYGKWVLKEDFFNRYLKEVSMANIRNNSKNFLEIFKGLNS